MTIIQSLQWRKRGLELYNKVTKETQMVQWLEIISEDRVALEAAAKTLNVHPLALEDCINRDQRAKLDEYENHQLLVWFMLAEGKTYEIQFLIFPNQILMVPHESPPSGATWWEYLRLTDNCKDVIHLLYQILDRVTDITWNELQRFFNQVDNFEQAMFVSECDPTSLMTLKRQLNLADFSLGHLPSVVLQIQNHYSPKNDLRWKFRDLHDHCQRIYHEISLYRTQIGGTIELYWGHQANRTNRHIKKLSLLASVAVPMTFWASFWGMNFHAIPFDDDRLFYVAVAIMLVSVVGTVGFLIKKGYWAD